MNAKFYKVTRPDGIVLSGVTQATADFYKTKEGFKVEEQKEKTNITKADESQTKEGFEQKVKSLVVKVNEKTSSTESNQNQKPKIKNMKI